MITETETTLAWKKYREAVNTADPGYVSAAPELEQIYGGENLSGWEDGAGKAMWPLAMGERNGKGLGGIGNGI